MSLLIVVSVSFINSVVLLLLGHKFISEGKYLDVVNFLASMVIEQEFEALITHMHVRHHDPRVILHNPAEKEYSITFR